MPSAMRRFLALFLVLAVPLQGLAGVTMAACASTHGASHQEAQVHDHVAMGHDHAAMDRSEAGATDPGEAGDPSSHRCAACAACCGLMVVPAPTFVLAGASPAPSLAIPFLEVARVSFQPATLERPPSPSNLG